MLTWAATSTEEAYPSKPIRLVIPLPPGGGTDYWARLASTKLAEVLRQPVIIDNRPGAATMIGAESVARSPADGYTLLVGAVGTFAVNPHIYSKIGYKPERDFTPVTMTARHVLVLVVPERSESRTVDQFIRTARRVPGQLNYGTPGNASPHHLAMEVLQSKAGIKLTRVPYKGGSPVATDLVGGQLDAAFLDFPSTLPFLQGGKLRALAVFSEERLAAFPDLPTLAESGFPGEIVDAWQGMVVPKGTPDAIVARLNDAYSTVCTDADMRKRLDEVGIVLSPSTPAHFWSYVKDESTRWGRFLAERQIVAD